MIKLNLFLQPEAIAVIRNATRWNSALYELENFMKAIETDPTLLTWLNAVKKHGSLSAYQLILLNETIAILELFEAASNDFQADFETVGNVIPAYLGVTNALTLTIKDRNGMQITNPTSRIAKVVKYSKGFVAGLRESLERRFSFILRDVHYVMGTFIAYIFLIVFHIYFLRFWILQVQYLIHNLSVLGLNKLDWMKRQCWMQFLLKF